MTDQTIASFQQRHRGRLIQPGDADYDAARALYNGMIDKRPRLIARAVDAADVIGGGNFAREQQVETLTTNLDDVLADPMIQLVVIATQPPMVRATRQRR